MQLDTVRVVNKLQKRKKTAAVCYCLLAEENSSERMSQLLCWCQNEFENAGYQKLYQGFAVGRNVPCAVPLYEYPIGFRCELDETECDASYLENLVLSHSILSPLVGKEELSHMDCYLVILSNEESFSEDEVLFPILELFKPLKKALNLCVCSLGVEEGFRLKLNSDFVDAYAKIGMKQVLDNMGYDNEE